MKTITSKDKIRYEVKNPITDEIKSFPRYSSARDYAVKLSKETLCGVSITRFPAGYVKQQIIFCN
jgi:hypothetical protein